MTARVLTVLAGGALAVAAAGVIAGLFPGHRQHHPAPQVAASSTGEHGAAELEQARTLAVRAAARAFACSPTRATRTRALACGRLVVSRVASYPTDGRLTVLAVGTLHPDRGVPGTPVAVRVELVRGPTGWQPTVGAP